MHTFMKLLIPVTNKHAPKMTVKTIKSPWIDEKLKNVMVERDEAEGMVNNLAAQPIGTSTADREIM